MKKFILCTFLAVSLIMSAQPVIAECEPFFTGGGIITEGHGQNTLKITFAVNLFIYEAEPARGSLQVNFHNVGDEAINYSDFVSIDTFSEVNIGENELDGKEFVFVRFIANGQFNGEDGWSILARFSDFGEPGVGKKKDSGNLSDAVRFNLTDPYGNTVYLTSQYFPWDQARRTILDGGNLTFHCQD